MRAGFVWTILTAVSLLAAFVLEALAWSDFRSSLSARLDRAHALEARVVRPAAAARLIAALLEHRLTLVAESEGRALAGAFSRSAGRDALEGYRLAGGDPAVLASAERALSASASGDADGEVALLRAVRLLREDASRTPSPARPEPPSSASRAAARLLWGAGAVALAVVFARAAGRSRRPASA